MFIYIQPTEGDPTRAEGRKWRPGTVMIPRDFPDLKNHMDNFAEYMAELYSDKVIEAINTQKYVDRWEPLSIPYLEYKKRKNLSVKIWERTSLLKNSITYWEEGSKWVVGVSKMLRYPGTDIKVYRIVRYLEYGTEKMPARPLFRPVQRSLSKDIRRYWKYYMKENDLN